MLDIEDIDNFPAGLRVLVVDADPTTLLPLQSLLLACRYQVTICHRASDALSLLREKESSFHLVLTEIHLPGGMHGLRLLEIIRLEMDLPVVVMSHDGRRDMVMKIIVKGACDYLLKPVRIEEISVIWQHVLRRRKDNCKSPIGNLGDNSYENDQQHIALAMQGTEQSNQTSNHEKDQNLTRPPSGKKSRMVWTTELHDQFVAVVNLVGLKNAVPKKILDLMNVPGLTRENIASHLQKYRLHLRRKSKSNITAPIYVKNVVNDCSADNSNPHEAYASALSKRLESQCSVFSELDSGKRSTLEVGPPVDQPVNSYELSLESIHQRGEELWCYDASMIMEPVPHRDHETPTDIIEPEQDNFIVMQRLDDKNPFGIEIRNELGSDGAPLNVNQVDVAAAAYVSLSAPSAISSIEDETEAEDTQHACSFILNMGHFGYDNFCSRFEPTFFSC